MIDVFEQPTHVDGRQHFGWLGHMNLIFVGYALSAHNYILAQLI